MEIYYFGTNGEKVGPVTKEGLSKLIEAGVVVESTKLTVNGKDYIAGQIPSIAQLIEKRKESNREPQSTSAPKINQSFNKVTESVDKAIGSADKIIGSAFDKIQESEKVKDFVRKSGRVYGSASKKVSDFTSKHFHKSDSKLNQKDTKHIRGFISKSLFASKEKKSIYSMFWFNYRTVRFLLVWGFILSLVVLVVKFSAAALNEIDMEIHREEYAEHLKSTNETILETNLRTGANMEYVKSTYHDDIQKYENQMVNCIKRIFYIIYLYPFVMLTYYFLGAMVRFAEESFEARSFTGEISSSTADEEADTSGTSTSSSAVNG